MNLIYWLKICLKDEMLKIIKQFSATKCSE